MRPGFPPAQRDIGQGRGLSSGVASCSRGGWAAAAAETMSGQRWGPLPPRAGSRDGPVARTSSASASSSTSRPAAATRRFD